MVDKTIINGLQHKLYDKRKAFAATLGGLVKEAVAQNDRDKIVSILTQLNTALFEKPQRSQTSVYGGLIALASVSVALGPLCVDFIDYILPNALICLEEPEARTRYYAIESLYNILKIARESVLGKHIEIFSALCKLSAERDTTVKSGFELLSRLVMDITAEFSCPEMFPQGDDAKFSFFQDFLTIISQKMHVTDPSTRMFLLQWLALFNSIPDFEMTLSIPLYLDALFQYLSDPSEPVRSYALKILSEYLNDLKDYANSTENDISLVTEKVFNTTISELIDIVLPYTESSDDIIRLNALQWLDELCNDISQEVAINYTFKILTTVLLNYASTKECQAVAVKINQTLLEYFLNAFNDSSKGNAIRFTDQVTLIFNHVCTHLYQKNPQTRFAALEWINCILVNNPNFILQDNESFNQIFNVILKSNEETTAVILEATMSVAKYDYSQFLEKFMLSLHKHFCLERELLSEKLGLIFEKICTELNDKTLLTTIAAMLLNIGDLKFSSLIVQYLNYIFLTSKSFKTCRKILRAHSDIRHNEFFNQLFPIWCYDAVSAISLCLVAQYYELSYKLIAILGEFELQYETLLQIDKLIRLLESPVFSYLRMQLLEPEKNPFLHKTLYGILMLLPQSSAFSLLKTRLSCIENSFLRHEISTENNLKYRKAYAKKMRRKDDHRSNH